MQHMAWLNELARMFLRGNALHKVAVNVAHAYCCAIHHAYDQRDHRRVSQHIGKYGMLLEIIMKRRLR